jgi:hypothetical protein
LAKDNQFSYSANNDGLGAHLIESTIGIQEALAALIAAEAEKVMAAVNIAGASEGGIDAINALANLNNSVSNVLGQINSIKGELNLKTQAGLTLRGF